jgi:2-polyprenyl-3-methyl-5-hydroxy-6-metoxy-1,4-benzoquinol methylase
LDIASIQSAIRKKYAEVSATAANKFNYPTGREGVALQGYDPMILVNMPEALIESFCGVGNPFTLGQIKQEETVLDIGCGAGFDMIVASHMVAQKGKVCGIDLTPEMLEKAKNNLALAAVSAYDVQIAGAEEIPYDEGTFDVVTSNGVLNLSPLKEKSFREIYRVLKPAGRLQFADIILKENSRVAGSNSLKDWSD